MPEEEIIVLANSLKMRGRCIAGISTETGAWIRPVSATGEGELYPSDFAVDGREPGLLDVVRFPCHGPAPAPAQPENVLLADGPWRFTQRLEPGQAYAELARFLAPGPDLLGTRSRGIPEVEADGGVGASLALVEPDEVPEFVVRRSVGLSARVVFELASQPYDLPVTDPSLKTTMLGAGEGTHGAHELGLEAAHRMLLSISLGKAFHGVNWKLATACICVS